MDLALMIERLIPSAEYIGSTNNNTEECFDSLTWNDQRTKPSWQDILDEYVIYSKESLISHLSNYRYQKEIGGISLGGLPVPTDDRTKTLLVGAYNDAVYENDPTRLRQFKIEGNFATLTNADVIAIALAIAAHVQKCFDAESEVFSMINDAETPLTTISEVESAFDTAYAQ